MSPPRLLRDPLWLAAAALFTLNQLVLKPGSAGVFWAHHFNDVLLIPCALPVLLVVHARLGLRRSEDPVSLAEVMGHLVIWSWLFEGIGPSLMRHATGDWRDVACYWGGGLIALAWWHRERFHRLWRQA